MSHLENGSFVTSFVRLFLCLTNKVDSVCCIRAQRFRETSGEMIDSIVLVLPTCLPACLPACCLSVCMTSPLLFPAVCLPSLRKDVITPVLFLIFRLCAGKEGREGVHRCGAGAEEEKRPSGGGWR